MNNLKEFLLLIFIFMVVFTYGQNEKSTEDLVDTSNIFFKDTVFSFVFDSISHNLGNIVPTNENNTVVKYFKYTGTKPIIIGRAWTGDPHFICEFPKGSIIPNKIYSFTVYFWHKGRQGNLNKAMGFDLSDGNRFIFKFTGTYLPITK